MADEVIVEEYAEQKYNTDNNISGAAVPELITTQVLDIAAKSAALDARTAYVIVQSNGASFWLKAGDSAVSAAANTDGNLFVPSGGSKELPVTNLDGDDLTYIDTAT